MFPDLFPYGRGHPGEKINNKVSFELCIQHYLRLSSHKFSKHPYFTLIMFDMISKRKEISNAYFELNISKSDVETIQSVEIQDLKIFLERKCQQIRNFQNGLDNNLTFSGKTLSEPVKLLLKNVEIVASSWFETIEEKTNDLRKAWSFTNYYNGAAVFVTLNPNDTGSALLNIYSGNTKVNEVKELDFELIPPRAAINDPYASYYYFERSRKLFFTKVIGWNMEESKAI